MPPPLLVDLVNGWGTVPRAKAAARDLPPIAAFLERHGVPGTGFTDAALERVADSSIPCSPPAAPPNAHASSPT